MKQILALALSIFALTLALTAHAEESASAFPSGVKMKMNFKKVEITNLIESFAKLSQKTFVVDPSVRGAVSIFTPGAVSLDEAFDLISTSLALNGYSFIERDGRYVVMASRNAQRSNIPTLTEIKSVKPERFVTYLVNLKHLSARSANIQLRIFPSKDGEMTPLEDSNQLLITDYISNVSRMVEMLKLLDQPVSAETAKIVKAAKAQNSAPSKTK